MEDRRRDLAAARLGYVTIRPSESDIMGSDSSVRDTVAEVIRVRGPRFSRSR